MENKKTILINLIGGPGIGKSTIAAFLYVQMKLHNFNVEQVQEVAKYYVYRGEFKKLNCQLNISKEQFGLFDAYNGIIDYIVTDGSILHGLYFNRNNPDNISDLVEVENYILEKHNSILSINILLERPNDAFYEKEGRIQSEDESKYIDKYLEAELIKHDIKYIKIDADILNVLGILKYIKNESKKLLRE